MKTIGEKAKKFREARGWNSTRMAKEVGTSRQNIENLELKGNRKPHYIIDLARVMGTTVDALLQGGTLPLDYGTNQPPASESIALGAINISANRRAARNPADVVAALGVLLAGVDPNTLTSVTALLGDFARNPSNARLASLLSDALTPEAFAQTVQREG